MTGLKTALWFMNNIYISKDVLKHLCIVAKIGNQSACVVSTNCESNKM
jgi:hypothetical protein